MTKAAAATTDRHGIGGNNPPTITEALTAKHAPLFARRDAWLKDVKKYEKTPPVPVTLEDCAKLDALATRGRDIQNDGDAIRTTEKEPYLRDGQEVDAIFNGGVRDVIGYDAKKPGMAMRLANISAARKAQIVKDEQARQLAEATKLQEAANKLAAKSETSEAAGRNKVADQQMSQALNTQEQAVAAQALGSADVSSASKTIIGGIAKGVTMEKVCTGIVRADLDLETLRPYLKEADLIAAAQAAARAGYAVKGAVVVERAKNNLR